MSRYHASAHYSPSGVADSAIHEAGRADLARHDRDPSPSGSETSSAFNNYGDTTTDEVPVPAGDDPYHALTSQTLNADGTPKRPMNAFMIFARKRRPQISAANQMMRTGDVSKILSKEWNSMEMSEKKFYLDQAKKLKDNFNSKYPDYVYRRRPNNSRKKRKTEPNHDDPSDGAHLGDPDDPAYDDPSPIDGDDPLMVPSPQDVQYTRAHPLNPSPPLYHTHDAAAQNAQQACSYPYSSDFHPPLPSSRLPHSMSEVGALAQGYPSQASSLYQNASPHQPSSLYSGGGGGGGLAGWEPSRAGSTRSDASRSNWPILPALNIDLARQRSIPSVPSALNGHGHHGHGPHGHGHGHAHTASGGGGGSKASDAYSPPLLPARPWSSATSSSSSSASTSHYGTNAFPTLNSAFFPNESPATKAMDLASPAQAPHSAHDYFSPPSSASASAGGTAAGGATSAGAGQMPQGVGRRPSAAAGSPEHTGFGQGAGQPYGSSAGWSQQQQQQQQYGRSAGGAGASTAQRMSGMPSLSPYSLQGSPEGMGSSRSQSTSGYWDDRFASGGR